jgi:hypothetical protein
MHDDDEAVRSRAYQIWEQSGRPEGEHESHWQRALAELGLINPARQPLGTTVPAGRDDDE